MMKLRNLRKNNFMKLVLRILLLILLFVVLHNIVKAQTNITYKAATSYNSDSSTVRTNTTTYAGLYGNIGAMYYNRQSNKWRVFQAGSWYDLVNVSGVFPRYGSTTQIPFMNSSGNFSYSPTFIRDTVNNNFYAVSGLTNTNTGTKNNNFITGVTTSLLGTGNIRWLNSHGESLTTNASSTGVIHNAYNYGVSNSITNSSTLGLFSPVMGPGVTQSSITLNGSATSSSNAQALLACRQCTSVNANVSLGVGYRSNLTNWGTFAGGYATTYTGNTHTGTVQQTTASGLHAFNWSANSTTSVLNEGARGNYSAILGGVNGDASGAGSIVLGGMDLKNPYDSTVMVARLAIKRTPTRNDTLSRIFAQNIVTGQVEYRDASTLGGVPSLTATEVAYGSVGNTITSEAAFNYNDGTNTLTTPNLEISQGSVTSGTYTPTLTATGNLSAINTSGDFNYMRVGNQVTVSGVFTGTATVSATNTQFETSLPFASNLTGFPDGGGTFVEIKAGNGVKAYGNICPNSASDRMSFSYISVDTNANNHSFTFMYIIK
jgi:hypothetical protein